VPAWRSHDLHLRLPRRDPGDHNHLLETIERVRFDRVGVFTYSREEGTAGHDMKPRVPNRVASDRQAALMETARRISHEMTRLWVGRAVEVLVDGVAVDEETGEPLLAGRTRRDRPRSTAW